MSHIAALVFEALPLTWRLFWSMICSSTDRALVNLEGKRPAPRFPAVQLQVRGCRKAPSLECISCI